MVDFERGEKPADPCAPFGVGMGDHYDLVPCQDSIPKIQHMACLPCGLVE